jgi:CubicO group peptidase (beta-lactamase class C family)
MKKFIFGGFAVLIVGLAVLAFVFRGKIDRASTISTLFTGAEQYENFNRMKALFPTGEMTPSDKVFQFGEGRQISLPRSFEYNGESRNMQAFLQETDTSALLVLKDGNVVVEEYWLTGGRDVQWLSMSVAKSFISAAVGIAISEGHIASIDEPVTQYVPSLIGSAYDGVRIKDVLQMSSGAAWNEDYNDPDSDINRFGRIFALGGSLNDFVATLTRDNEPGAFNRYNSTDTQVLGMLLVNATGRSITDYMAEKLWHPMGAESAAYWLLDDEDMEMAFAGLNATARDYAKIGELYRLGGRLNGQQIIPEAWVTASVTPDAPHLQPGKNNPASDFELGYGYQWWIPEGNEGEFSAIGVYNQFVFVNPTDGVVIVKLSANSDYGSTPDERSYRELETIEMFRAIVGVVD